MTSCPICEARNWDHDAIVASCYNSVVDTAIYLCGFERIADSWFHQEIYNDIQDIIESGKKNILLMLARDHLKTTMLVALTVWAWLRDPMLRVKLFHSSSKQSGKMLPVLEDKIFSWQMQHFYPYLVPDKRTVKINSEQLTIRRPRIDADPSFSAHGVGSIIHGAHCDWQYHDDLVELSASDSEVEMAGVVEFFENVPSLFDRWEKQLTLVTGTLWKGGFYEYVQSLPLFTSIVLGAEADERFFAWLYEKPRPEIPSYYRNIKKGDPIWPQFFPPERLRELQIRMGPINYSRQYLNKPSIDEEYTFREEDARYYAFDSAGWLIFEKREYDAVTKTVRPVSVHLPITNGFVTATCDPATGEHRKTDESAINVSVHFPDQGLAFVLEEWSGQPLVDQLVEKIFEVYARWKPYGLQRIGIERAGFQVALKRWVLKEQRDRGIYFPVDMIDKGANRSKIDKMIDGFQPYYRHHVVYFRKEHEHTLVKQLCGLRVVAGNLVGKSPNKVDALVMQALQYWRFRGLKLGEDIPDEGEPLDNVATITPLYAMRTLT